MVDDQLFLHAGICTIILTCQIVYILSIILMNLWKIYLLQDVGSIHVFSHPIVNHILLHSVIINLHPWCSKPIFEFEYELKVSYYWGIDCSLPIGPLKLHLHLRKFKLACCNWLWKTRQPKPFRIIDIKPDVLYLNIREHKLNESFSVYFYWMEKTKTSKYSHFC